MARLASIIIARSQTDASIIRQVREQDIHAFDFGCLVVENVIGKIKQHRIIGRAGQEVEVIDHCHRAFMMADHQGQELPVKGGARIGRQNQHLVGCCHAHIDHHLFRQPAMSGVSAMRMTLSSFRSRFVTLAEPGAHEFDFVRLGGGDPASNFLDVFAIGPLIDQSGHFDGLGMMRDHILHKHHIIARIA